MSIYFLTVTTYSIFNELANQLKIAPLEAGRFLRHKKAQKFLAASFV